MKRLVFDQVENTKVRVLVDAIPFCFGPATVLHTLLEEIQNLDSEIEFDVISHGSTEVFLERNPITVRKILLDSENRSQLAQIDVRSYTAFVCVCNPVSYMYINGAGIPTAYVDFLLWMESQPKPPYFSADLYIAENYPGLQSWLSLRGSEIKNLRVVPPIIRSPQRLAPNEAQGVLVCLGGQFSRLTNPNHRGSYACLIAELLEQAIGRKGIRREVTVTGHVQSMEYLQERFNIPKVRFQQLSHSEFLTALGGCEFLLTQPGLYAPFEAFLAGVPTVFLPPSNYTQLLQLRHFRAANLAPRSLSWDELFEDTIPASLPEAEGVTRVLSAIDRAVRDSQARRTISTFLEESLFLDNQTLEVIANTQINATRQFGHDGAGTAAAIIHQWLRRQELRE